MIKIDNKKYHEVFNSNSCFKGGFVDIVILCNTGGFDMFDEKVKSDCSWAFNQAADKITKDLRKIKVLNDPKLKQKKENAKLKLKQLFVESGLTPIHMREIRNEKCDRPCCYHLPWFIVTSEIGPVTVGESREQYIADFKNSDYKEIGYHSFDSCQEVIDCLRAVTIDLFKDK